MGCYSHHGDSGVSHEAVHGSASVPASTWTTVTTMNVSGQTILTGFGADIGALLATNYRFRLRVNGTVVWSEVASTTAIAYIPFRLSVADGDTVDVQVFHSEAAATECVASIAYDQE